MKSSKGPMILLIICVCFLVGMGIKLYFFPLPPTVWHVYDPNSHITYSEPVAGAAEIGRLEDNFIVQQDSIYVNGFTWVKTQQNEWVKMTYSDSKVIGTIKIEFGEGTKILNKEGKVIETIVKSETIEILGITDDQYIVYYDYKVCFINRK